MWTLYNSTLYKILFLKLSFFQPFKNINAFLVFGLYKKEAIRQIWPTSQSLLTPVLKLCQSRQLYFKCHDNNDNVCNNRMCKRYYNLLWAFNYIISSLQRFYEISWCGRLITYGPIQVTWEFFSSPCIHAHCHDFEAPYSKNLKYIPLTLILSSAMWPTLANGMLSIVTQTETCLYLVLILSVTMRTCWR